MKSLQSRLGTVRGVALGALLAAAPAAAEEPPVPEILREFPTYVSMGRLVGAILPSIQPLSWRFRLAREEFRPFEPVWGELEAHNPNADRYAYRFAEPWIGPHVATVAVWRCRWQDGEGGGGWSAPEPVQLLNMGRSAAEWKWRGAAYQGPPVTLGPGERRTWRFPLGVVQVRDFGKADLWWFPGAHFVGPGKYRVYLQYLNLEAYRPWARRHDPAYRVPPWTNGDPLAPALTPVVLGPFEFTVLPEPGGGTDNTRRLAKYFSLLPDESDCKYLLPPGLVSSVMGGLPPDDSARRVSLRLTLLRARFSELEPAAPEYAAQCRQLLEELRAVKSPPDTPLADAYTLTECHLLAALKEWNQAERLANKLGNPDAAVFVADLEWRRRQTPAE